MSKVNIGLVFPSLETNLSLNGEFAMILLKLWVISIFGCLLKCILSSRIDRKNCTSFAEYVYILNDLIVFNVYVFLAKPELA